MSDEISGGRSHPPSDVHQLTDAVARGDPEAFRVFYEAWFDRAFRLASALTRRDESFCLDVVQDSMLKVVRSISPFSDEKKLERWLARTVYTTALDRLRREARRRRRERRVALLRGGESVDAGGETGVELEERIQWLREQLTLLSRRDRQLLLQRFGLGKTLREVGLSSGLTSSAAHGRIRRIILRLRAAARNLFGDAL